MEFRNCINCGAPLHFLQDKAICKYCNTEYELDNLGRIKDYQVELMIYGEKRKFYISRIEVEPLYIDFGRDLSGHAHYTRGRDEFKLTLISY